MKWKHLAGRLGETDGATIWLDPRQYQRERRSTLAHELTHVQWGHDGCVSPVVERRVRHHAGRWLIPDTRELTDALIANGGHLEPTAEDLWVDGPTLAARLDRLHMHPAEKAYIGRRLEEEGICHVVVGRRPVGA